MNIFQDDEVYVIDEGPLLPSLEHLIEYYCIRADGLPSKLTLALSKSKKCDNRNYYHYHKEGQEV